MDKSKIVAFGFWAFTLGFFICSLIGIPEPRIEVRADEYASSVIIGNSTPVVGTVTPGSITLTEDTTVTATSTGTVTDGNGYEDLSSVIAVFYDADATTNACPADANDCYRGADVTCATSSCSSLQCSFTCTATVVEYYANAADWKWYVSAGDGTATGSETSASTTVATLNAIKLDLADITYGTVSLDATSTEKTIVATNTGNASPVDIKVSGTTMVCDEKGILDIAQQHWNTTASQSWSSGETLTDTPAYTQMDIAQRTGVATTGDIYWQLQIPATGYAGTCSGTNTFTASAVD